MRTLLKLLLACAMAAGLNIACAQSAPPAPCAVPTEPGYFPARNAANNSVIVFVHGVMGDAVGTWKFGRWFSDDVFWPCLLQKQPIFNGANIYLYGFRSTMLSQSPTITEAADRLFSDLESDDVFRHSHITFVAHSMGGLIVTRMLLRHADRSDVVGRVRLVMFYGTPGTGAAIAEVGKVLSSNGQFFDMTRDMTKEDSLDDWRRRWLSGFKNTPHFCVNEMSRVSMLPWSGLVVPPDSAAALCDGKSEPLYGMDHLEIVKPRSESDDSFRTLRNHYSQCVTPYLRNQAALSESQTATGKELIDWFYEFQQAVQTANDNGADLTTLVKAKLFARPGKASDRYAVPKSNATSLSPSQYESLSSNPFAQEFRNRIGRTLPTLKLDAVISLDKLDDYTRDDLAADLRSALLANGTLAADDMVLVGQDANDATADRTLIFVSKAAAPSTPDDARFKGWARLPRQVSRCQ